MNIKVQWLKQPRQVKFLGACGLDYAVTDPVRGKPKPPQAKVILFGGAAGGGKALKLDTPIPTPGGWKTMGEIELGDKVFDENGKECFVLACSPVMHGRPCYKVVFSDGAEIIADAEHLWKTFSYAERMAAHKRTEEYRVARRSKRPSRGTGKKPWLAERNKVQRPATVDAPIGTILTTVEILDTLKQGRRLNHSIDVCGPLELPDAELPIEPYVLGAWLGDGKSGSGVVYACDKDRAVIEQIEAQGYRCTRHSNCIGYRVFGLTSLLRETGILGAKRIPGAYLRAAAWQRIRLLQGLMDTDGYVDERGQCEFTTTSAVLAEGVREIILSLGIKVTVTTGAAMLNGKDCGLKYRLKFITDVGVFSLERKAEKQKTCGFRGTHARRYIADVAAVESVPVRCIKVSSGSKLFLAGREMIPTHNSDALIMTGLVGAIAFPGCSIAYFRRKYTELAGPGGAIMRTQQLYRSLAKWNGTQRRWTFPNGSVFEFCHAENEVDVHSYQSQQFDILLIDEASQFTRFQLRYLLTRNRATVKGVVPFCAMGSNPGGIGHGYLKREFVDVGPQEIPVDVEVEPGKFEKHLFIPSFLHDNQVLEQRDPGYRQTLENQPEEIRRALLEGDWSIFAGQYFKSFRRILHVVEEPFTPPEHWYKFASLDWGFVAPCAILWHCVEPSSGRIITYREYYGNQKTASETAEIFLEMSTYNQGGKRLPEKIHYVKASPDMWQERGLSKTRGEWAEKGESIADEFLNRDIPLEIADNRRVIGWTRVREYLKVAPDGLPFWQCTSNCTNLIRTLPELIHDPRDVEDVDDKCEDHACLVAGTMINTETGAVSIETIRPGMKVFTREGYKSVIATREIGIKKVYTVTFTDGRKLTGTADHPVWIEQKSFIPLAELKPEDKVLTEEAVRCRQKSLSSMVLPFDAILNQKEEATAFITDRALITLGEELDICTRRYGNIITAKYRRVIMFIIKTITRLKTTLRTWNVFPDSIIFPSMVNDTPKDIRRRSKSIWTRFAHLQQHGMEHRREENCQCETGRRYGKIEGQLKEFAINAAKNMRLKILQTENILSAQMPVNQLSEGIPGWITKHEFALFAGRSSQQTSISKLKPVANTVVHIVDIYPAGTEKVYNLQVEDVPEYFANGILVHNCEALRYGLMSRPAPGDGESFMAGGFPGERSANSFGFDTERDADGFDRDEYDDEVGGNDGPGFYSI